MTLRDPKYELQILNSRADIYGNCYYGMILVHLKPFDPHDPLKQRKLTDIISIGKVSAPNVDTLDCEKMGWRHSCKELKIREFNQRFKGTQYLGCRWDDIKTKLRADLARYLLEKG